MLRECVRARENERAREKIILKEVQEDEYESDHVSFAWNGTCFHTSIAPLKLRDGNTYTFTYTYIHRERERERGTHHIRQ